MAKLNFGKVVLCCANYCQMLSAGSFYRGSAQVTKTIVNIHIAHYFCLKKCQNAIFWCKVGENAILGLPWAKMVRIYVFMINILSVTCG